MADDKRGREKQSRDANQSQRERDMEMAVERGDEPEPPVPEELLDDIEADLDAVAFPATGAEVVAAVGDRTVETAAETYTLEELLPDADAETFDSPDAVRVRVQRPTVATAMKRITEAADDIRDAELSGSQRNGYERTFRELRAIDAVDEDEGIPVVADWIIEQLREDRALPSSRSVRREAAKYCRANGYEVRNDEWLGI